MKKFFIPFAALAMLSSCDLLDSFKTPSGLSESEEAKAGICVHFTEDAAKSFSSTKSTVVDTNDFILSVVDSKGLSLYYGSFGAAPEKILVSAGTYTVSAVSCDFSTPLFDSPQYGDSQTVVLKAGEVAGVVLECSQQNCGVRLDIDPAFLDEYPNACFFLKAAEGRLMYSYSEKRTAYFRPGTISLVLSDNSTEKTLCTRRLAAQEMLTVKVRVQSSSSSTSAGIHIQVDTTRSWSSDEVTIGGEGGGGNSGSEKEKAISVYQVEDHIGDTDVWVYGYIVGGDLTSSKCSFEPPFSSRTNIVIAAKSSCTDKESCVSVQLPSKGTIRSELNLVDNESLLGRKIFLKGDIVAAYYGIPGIQSLTEYSF